MDIAAVIAFWAVALLWAGWAAYHIFFVIQRNKDRKD